MTTTTIRTGLFRDTGTDPTTMIDLQSAISQALEAATTATNAVASTVASAATASAAAVSASSAAAGAEVAVEAAAAAATTALASAVTAATSDITASVTSATAAQSAASTSATNAASSATAAAGSSTSAAASKNTASTYAGAAGGASTAAGNSAAAATLSATAAAGSAAAAGASATAAAASASSIIGRNALINGDMSVWQRGDSMVPAPNGATFLADRWATYFNGTGGAAAVTRITDLASLPTIVLDAGIKNALRYTVTTQPTGITLRQLLQKMEGVSTMAGRTVRLSFYTWTTSGTLSANVFLAQEFGTGGSPSATVNGAAQSFTATTTPTRIGLTFNVASIAGKVLGTSGTDNLTMALHMAVGSAHEVFFTGAQIEAGAVSTPFEEVPPGLSVALCQRFYRKVVAGITGYLGGAGNLGVRVPVSPPMRATPSITVEDIGGSGGTGPLGSATADSAYLYHTASGAGAMTVHAAAILSSEL